MIRHLLALLGLLTLLASCAARPGPEVLNPHPQAAARIAAARDMPEGEAPRVIRILAATNRASARGFEGVPAFATAYRYYDISVPPERPGGRISYPDATPDPSSDYIVLESGVMDRTAFLAAARKRASRARSDGAEDAIALYVHGYNTSFQEALFRLAQIGVEADPTAAPVLFSWPSRARPLEYEADRQAALFSRGTLADLVEDLTAGSNRRLLLFGHSMGGFLTVESLRTLKLTGRDAVLDRLDVVLAAPDIDIFVFAEQMKDIGRLHHPMVILTSPDDRALALSSRVAGGRPRLGALPASSPMVARAAKRADIQIIDISEVRADPMRHLRYIRLTELYSRQLEAEPEMRLPGAYIFDAISRSLVAP